MQKHAAEGGGSGLGYHNVSGSVIARFVMRFLNLTSVVLNTLALGDVYSILYSFYEFNS
jgi:hypothetical protein